MRCALLLTAAIVLGAADNPPGCSSPGCEAMRPSGETWHLLTKSNSGTVSLIKGLTRDECETMRKKLWLHCPVGQVCMESPGSIDTAECFE